MGLFTKLFGESFSHKFCCPPLLQNLDLSENSISCLPAWVKSLPQLRNLSVQSCKMLKSLTGIPSCITELSIQGCSSLERMTYHSILHKCKLVVDDEWGSLVLIEGGFKLEDLENAGAQILGRFGLDVERMENVVFKMEHFLGSEDKMLPLQSEAYPSRLCIHVLNIKSTQEPTGVRNQESIVHNRTKDMQWVHTPTIFGMPEGREEMTWLRHWEFGNLLEAGDEISIAVSLSRLKVKEFGVELVCDDQVLSDPSNCLVVSRVPLIVPGDISQPGVVHRIGGY
ncbi:putative methionine S-methyltransferase-like [Capsicum annuum]|uniref:TMV resistance protein N-like n=1 Tax=Capsicum annuum TaxID=4072 RepID=A0A2G2Y1R7_CAPAN|nr:putative methionine S-methyltransferase-like [Capsicum annuum]KAF3615389.1 putative methionine S-methyltransferase-like [Capsicum annuum]PHT63693.1 hypothetical protein T459_32515 [Capsicum annuum]